MAGGSRVLWIFLLLFSLVTLTVWASDDAAPKTTTPTAPPKAKRDDVVDTIQGQKIADPYRWLEDSKSPETQEFVREELAYTRGLLDPLPGRNKIEHRLTELVSIGTIGTPQIGGKYYFYTRREGTQNQPILYVREGLHGTDRVLFDANKLAADGTVALDWWHPSHDGRYVAYGTSPSGSEMSTLHVVETANGKLLPDTIERTRAASVAWKLDDSGFYYTRYPKKGEVAEGQEFYNRHVFYHAVGGDPDKDTLIFGEGRNPEDWPEVNLSNDDRWLLITVAEGWAKSELYLADLKTSAAPVRITTGKNFLYDGEVYEGNIYIVSNEDAPRYRLFRVAASKPGREFWQELIPQSDAVLQSVGVIHGDLVALYEKTATSQVKLFDIQGKLLHDVQLPAIGTVPGIGGNWDSHEMFLGFQSFTVPPSVYHMDLTPAEERSEGNGKPAQLTSFAPLELWGKIDAPSIDPAQYEVNQLWYTSKDGTRVPMFVFHKKGIELNGHNPTLLTGYGGFNISLTPTFVGQRYVWLEHGGVFAVANLRGGSEFGEDWHRAGMLGNKQNVFDDFAAAAEFLISEKYTDKDHLAIQGGSNGGLLMGAAFTQHPDLYRAVVCQVPLLDMLRYQNFQIAKLWIPEYGSADDAQQFHWLYAYSPYHHVKESAEYPAILFMTADTDTRVDPMHAKKMAALMQAEAANGQSRERPILLRVETKAGHGAGKPVHKIIEENVDIYSFLFWQLGVTP
jgi:prolyl oligopeptidase